MGDLGSGAAKALTCGAQLATSLVMKARHCFALLGVSSVLLALGCVVEQPAPQEGPSGKTGQPIINGDPDTTHDAVVAVLSNGGACSGTVIAKDVVNKRGYVLTAAHCVPQPPRS
jgi:hypothetical protein